MLKRYLPDVIYNAIARHLNYADINEIRMRVNCPLVVCIKNKKYFVGVNGFSDYDNAIICTYEMMQDFVYKMCDNAVYAVNDQLKQGFITLPKGVRVGICGEVVYNEGQVITIKNFQSANIRIPHHIKGCSLMGLRYMLDDSFLNTLIVSPAGAGKTTFVQGLAKGLEISEAITSPTFTIIKEYHEGKLPLYHMDVYRLEDPLEMENLGYEEYFYGDGVTVVEWAKLIEELWPEEYLKMEFSVLAEGRMLALEPVGDRYVTMVEELTGHDYSEC